MRSVVAWLAAVVLLASAGVAEAQYSAPPAKFARPLITKEAGGGELNLAPSISPDGSKVVFLSERELLSIDLFLADRQTGAVTRRLLRTAGDPHFDSLQFITSAGGWHPDGRRFYFTRLTSASSSTVTRWFAVLMRSFIWSNTKACPSSTAWVSGISA